MKTKLLFILLTFNCKAQAQLQSSEPWMSALLLGGSGTYVSSTPTVFAYSMPYTQLTPDDLQQHIAGDKLFERKFSDDLNRPDYGLGPAYNHVSCVGCHTQDGRGSLPIANANNAWTKVSMGAQVFVRYSIENPQDSTVASAQNNWGAPQAVPGFGTQLFNIGSYFLRPDSPGTGLAELWFKYEYTDFTYPDGSKVTLRKPLFAIQNPYDESENHPSRLRQSDVKVSPRLTPAMCGLGLVEAISDSDILDLAKRDLSRWGIHGHPNFVLDQQKLMAGHIYPISVGRFGHKASTATVLHQSMAALNGDMGVTNPFFPKENIADTSLFASFANHWKPGLELDKERSLQIVFYSQTLAVPSRRDVQNPEVMSGAQLFKDVGCTQCHQPYFRTGAHSIQALSNQDIYPYSDFLLHDMGDGLADGRKDFQASGKEWKTKQLWGIGLTQTVNPRAGFLHDGRAKTLEEAILWHDGEAAVSKNMFANLNQTQRSSLIAFLKSL